MHTGMDQTIQIILLQCMHADKYMQRTTCNNAHEPMSDIGSAKRRRKRLRLSHSQVMDERQASKHIFNAR